jgi:hypothetical protein
VEALSFPACVFSELEEALPEVNPHDASKPAINKVTINAQASIIALFLFL